MIRLTEFSDAEVDRFCAFSRIYYDSAQTTDRALIAWKFPAAGRFQAKHLTFEVDGRILGRAALCRRPFTCGGVELSLNIPSDLLIDTSGSGAACLVQLVNAYPKLGTDGLVHPSNAKSEPIYRRLFKFPVVTKLKSVGMPVRVETVLPRKAALLPLRAVFWAAGMLADMVYRAAVGLLTLGRRDLAAADGPVTVECEDLLAGFRSLVPHHITRDREFLAWRYAASPQGFREIVLKSRGRDAAKAVYRVATHQGVTAVTVMDILIARHLSIPERAAIVGALRAAARREGAALVYYLGNFRNPVVRHVAAVGFVTIPDRFLPHASPVFAYALRPPVTPEIIAGMYLTLGDLDYF